MRLDLPALHWRTAYWALAVWSVGATVSLVEGGADLTVTDDPQAGADGVVVVTLAALARAHPGPLPAGAMDEARSWRRTGTSSWPGPSPRAATRPWSPTAGRLDYASLVPDRGWPTGARVRVAGPAALALPAMLGAWAVDGSVLLVRDADPTGLPTGCRRRASPSTWREPSR